jgi:energy-coupling factor transport system ATP-binding protein
MIEFSNVSLIYPNATKTVIEDLSFSVAEGEFVLVIGSTGVGKSSLLRLINGLVPHHTGGILGGDISVDGLSTRTVKPGGLAHLIGIVGQNPAHGFVADTVEEELAFGMETLNVAPDIMRKRIEEILDLLSLAPLRNRLIGTLSGGEQQRVAIGAALVMHPKVLVLDEPTSALDPIAAEEVLSILQRLVHDLSLTVIVSEHRLERVIQFVDRVIYIEGDGSSRIGTPQEIFKDSPIAPPIVHLSRALGLKEVGLTVRQVRRETEELRTSLKSQPETSQIVDATEVLNIKDLSVDYDRKKVIERLNLSVHRGEIVALMGRNGAGKSSLLTSAVGINDHATGAVRILGRDLMKVSTGERMQLVGYVPQEPSDLLYHQSVGQECASADRDLKLPTGSTFNRLQELIPGISPDTHPRDLSEGQRLALVVSIVISGSPELIILDEPTRGLDYSAKATLSAIIKELAQSCAVIVATHDVELVAEVATRVIFIADGEIVADGPTIDVLLSSPSFAPQVAKVMAPSPWLTVGDVISAIENS